VALAKHRQEVVVYYIGRLAEASEAFASFAVEASASFAVAFASFAVEAPASFAVAFADSKEAGIHQIVLEDQVLHLVPEEVS
jgi:hypothetical protein